MKYKIYFQNINGDNISVFKNIPINSIKFKISKNEYNNSQDTEKYLFQKKQDSEIYYESENKKWDYTSKSIIKDVYGYQGNDAININEIIINDRYKISNFKTKHPKLQHEEFESSNKGFYKIYIIDIEIILDENETKIVILNPFQNKYSKLLKLLRKYLNSKNSKIKTLYNDLLNKMREENILNIVPSSIININTLLKLLSEYLGTKSKNPNILYHNLLAKKLLFNNNT